MDEECTLEVKKNKIECSDSEMLFSLHTACMHDQAWCSYANAKKNSLGGTAAKSQRRGWVWNFICIKLSSHHHHRHTSLNLHCRSHFLSTKVKWNLTFPVQFVWPQFRKRTFYWYPGLITGIQWNCFFFGLFVCFNVPCQTETVPAAQKW